MPDWRTHPEEGDLIRYCDGELRAKQAARISSHLEACWECRTRLDDFKLAIAEYVRYRRDVVEPALPQPPQPWGDLRSEFAHMPAREPAWKRIVRYRTVWLIASAAMAGTGVLLYHANEAHQVAAPPVVRALPPRAVSVPPTTPARPVTPGSALQKAPTPDDELRVVSALDRIGANLGDPIEIVRSRDRIVVTCMGLTPQRTSEVRAAVATIPGVTVEVSPKPSTAPGGSPLEVVGAPHAADNEQLADELLKSSEAMMARAHALRSLALRFPPAVESRMSAASRSELAGMRQRHETALEGNVSAIARSVPSAPPPAGDSSDELWQSRALREFSDAEQVDRLLGLKFAANRTAARAPAADLAAALARLLSDLKIREPR